MAKKRTIRRKVAPLKRTARPKPLPTRLRKTWSAALARVADAEARLQKQVRGLLNRNKINPRNAATVIKDVRALVDRERSRGMKELEGRLASLQARARKERKSVSRMIDNAVRGALAALNIPSRQEIHHLALKVSELSRRIGAFKR